VIAEQERGAWVRRLLIWGGVGDEDRTWIGEMKGEGEGDKMMGLITLINGYCGYIS
jgi:hypothetical protein